EIGDLKCKMTDDGCYPAQSTVKIKFYGYIKLDASYDNARISDGNYAKWVEAPGGRRYDDEVNITARQSRFGMIFKGPDFGDATTSAQVEVDFYEGTTENKNQPYMRHAYMELKWKDKDFSLLAGQTWDVIAPLFTPTVNYSVAWWAGDIGYRRPQIRVTKGFGSKDSAYSELTLAVARMIGDSATDSTGVTRTDPGDTGEDATLPCLQGRFSVSFPFGGKRATLGVSGHWSEEEYDYDLLDHSIDVRSWSGNIDLSLPVTDAVTAQGEAFIGENLDAYLGGIGQGIATTRDVNNVVTKVTAIKSRGGWGALSIKPADSNFSYNVGASSDHISEHDAQMMTGNPRLTNFSAFGNVWYKINSAASWGFEISRWRTKYKTGDPGNSLRFQTSFMFKF
ncbi:MAG: hypothetical protein ABIK28_10890, partial [Planctomycetota bacterium]